MKLKIEPGKYVLAVSGGIDSMSLLDILAKQPEVNLVVAHFNHGIRPDAGLDETLVVEVSKNYGLKAAVGQGKLGAGASEEAARLARYSFLNEIKDQHHSQAIITAHHQDDLIETAFLNLLRGTNRRGLTAISDSDIIRPLLNTPKAEIVEYAESNNLKWLEDSTNGYTDYARNYLRQNILKKLSPDDRQKLISNIEKVAIINKSLNKEIATISHMVEVDGQINRSKFIDLPPLIANEVMVALLREQGVKDFDKRTVDRLSLAVKTALPNTQQPVKTDLTLKIGQKFAHFTTN